MKRIESVGVVLGVSGAALVAMPASSMILCIANLCWVVGNSIMIAKFVIVREDKMAFLFIVYLVCSIIGVVNNLGWVF